MTTTKLNIHHLDTTDEAQHYHRYQGKHKPQSVYISLDIEHVGASVVWSGMIR